MTKRVNNFLFLDHLIVNLDKVSYIVAHNSKCNIIYDNGINSIVNITIEEVYSKIVEHMNDNKETLLG